MLQSLGIVGAGSMGRGIAQVAALAGLKVLLFDSRPGAAEEASAFVRDSLKRQVEKGRLEAAAARAAENKISVVPVLDRLAACETIVEAIVEELGAKRQLFATLDQLTSDATILASNTSSLSITEIASACQRPTRVAGMHFFNPVPAMNLVEVVRGLRTAAPVIDRLVELAEKMGKRAVRVEDTPGFLVNHVGRGYGPEALRIYSERIATPLQIDRIMKSIGFRMGPFELFDLTGLDVSQPVMEEIYRQFFDEPMFRPSVVGRRRLAAGLLGRKSGEGFYRYPETAATITVTPDVPLSSSPIWIDETDGDLADALAEILKDAGATCQFGGSPPTDATCVVAPIGLDATTAAVRRNLDPRRTVAIDLFFGVDRVSTVMKTPLTGPERSAALAKFLQAKGLAVEIINDSPGFVAQRILAMIVNVASNVAQQQIATPADIDVAVKAALAYPSGPLEWGDRVGADRILAVLDALHDFYGDPRYRPSPWLKRRAILGISLLTAE